MSIIVALDAKSQYDALTIAEQLDPALCRVKVGKELFTHEGPNVVKALHDKGFEVFLDLKFHDIPNTVARAAEAAVALHVDMFNVHASGGSAMMKEAVSAASTYADKTGRARPVVLAVTVLTSLNDDDLHEIGFQKNVDELVLHLAGLAIRISRRGSLTRKRAWGPL